MGADLRIIGIQGAMGAGKSTVRRHLEREHGAQWVVMAGPLKRALMAMGATHEEIYGSEKTEPNELWGGKTNRFAQQTIGTEWGRQMIHPDIWVNCVRRELQQMREEREGVVLVVIDDVRFPNEAKMVHDLGGVLWTVRRHDVEYLAWKQKVLKFLGWEVSRVLSRIIGVHESEAWWPMAQADVVIQNELSEARLRHVVDTNLERAHGDVNPCP